MVIHNKEYVSFMTNYVDWLPPQTIATSKNKMNLIFVSVTPLLSKMASYAIALQEEKIYMSPDIGYHTLSAWFIHCSKSSSEHEEN